MKQRELQRLAPTLGFIPQPATRWLAPGELLRTAVKTVISMVFADYSDKREIQAALPAHLVPFTIPINDEELWIDFVADTGDGFDATYTLAKNLARESLTVNEKDGPKLELPRASLLVLGGDEVYPTASTPAYEDRLTGLLRAALPQAPEPNPLLVALPGNHDWYDGLTAFLRIFTQDKQIGGWVTRQRRSYFAVRLTRKWWLAGLDTQLGTYIDKPQLDYFRANLSRHLNGGDRVILCTPTPVWYDTVDTNANAFNSIHWFDRNVVRNRVNQETKVIERTGATVELWLTGDRHHYARYVEDGTGRQMITCGLGGAFTSATHRLPATLSLPPANSTMREKDEPTTWQLREQSVYPASCDSRRMRWRLASPWSKFWLPRRNPGFGSVVAAGHILLLILCAGLLGAVSSRSPVDAMRVTSYSYALGFLVVLFLASSALMFLSWIIGCIKRRRMKSPSDAIVGALMQFATAGIIVFTGVAIVKTLDLRNREMVVVTLGAWAVMVGWSVGSTAFALFTLCARSSEVVMWQMSGQAIEDYKGFLRMRIDREENLTIYPLSIDTVCRDWDAVSDKEQTRPEPIGEFPFPKLIETPFTIGMTRESQTGARMGSR